MAFDLDEEELRATRKMNKADRDEIEVNEYVRTRAGHIYKITNIDENGLIYWNKIQCGWSEQQLEVIIVKHHQNIIKLIKVRRLCKRNGSIRYT